MGNMSEIEAIERWRRQGSMTDPKEGAQLLGDLPTDVAALCRTIGRLLIHCEWLSAYEVRAEELASISRETLPVSKRLARIHAADDRPLSLGRDPRNRSAGTCRDYALLLCAILRHQGVAARVRCGFASYLAPRRWEDHWVCERWLPDARRWALADAQLDDVLAAKLAVDFDPTDIPRRCFMSGGEAWRACRSGRSLPGSFGHGTSAGLWFVAVNVVRDHLALNHRETSLWDSWRRADDAQRVVRDSDLAWVDELAANPERAVCEVPAPPWPAPPQ
jgi:hypothetical protein